MKKRLTLLSLSLCTALAQVTFTPVRATENNVADVDGVGYATLQEAVDAIEEDGYITLLRDVENGDGFVVQSGKSITLDFAGYTYSLNGNLVGSAGTETLGIQVLKDSYLSLLDGELNSNKAKVLVQNYGDFSTNGMVLNHTTSVPEGKTYYTVSVNNGSYSAKQTLVNSANDIVAIDGYLWPSAGYGAVTFMINSSTVNGDVTFSGDGKATEDKISATIVGSKMNGDLEIADYLEDSNIFCGVANSKVNDTYLDYLYPNMEKNEDGIYQNKNAKFKVDSGYGYSFYNTLQEAVDYAPYGQPIELMKNVEGDGVVFDENASVVIDFKGYTYTINGELVGSSGTKTLGFQILDGANVTLKNGTLESEKTKVLIQNYSDLKVENMTLDNQRADNEKTYYTVGNNNGSLLLKDSTVKAADGHVAFDVYYWSQYYPGGVNVEVTNSNVIGDIEYGGDGVKTDYSENAKLKINSVKLDGSFKETATLPEHGIEILDGVFTELPKANYLANGLKFEKNSDGTYGVVVAKDPHMDGGILVDRMDSDGEAAVYFELHDIAKDDEVVVKLYSGDEYLTYKAIKAPADGDLGCSFYTVGTSSSWQQDEWTAYDLIVPTHADLYVNGVKVATDKVDFAEKDWAPFAGTVETTIGGGILVDRTESENEAGIYFELENLPTDKERTYRVELYSGETYLTYKEIKLQSEGVLGCTFYTVGTSSSWKQDAWTAKEELVPTHAVFYIDGVKVGIDNVDFAKEDFYKFPGTAHAEGVLVNVKEATCTEEGYTGDLVCPICGEVLVKGTVIEKEIHNHKLDEATVKEATCTEDGYTGDMVCECGDVIKGEVVEATGHIDADGNDKCDVCDADVEIVLSRVEETAEVLLELHEAVENGDLDALKKAVAKMEALDEKYKDAEDITEEEMAKFIKLVGCKDEEELFEMILTDTLVAAYVLELEEPYNAFKEEKTLENAKALIEAVYDPENVEYLVKFYDDIEDLYAEAEKLVAEADKDDDKPSDDDKPVDKPTDDDKVDGKEDGKDDGKDDNNDGTEKGDSPITGDSTNIAGLSFAFLASLVGILYALINKKRVD